MGRFSVRPQAWLAGPQAWLAGPQAWLDGPEGGMYERTNGRKISPFYRTSSPIGAAALPPPMKTKEKVEQGKGTADHLMPLGYLLPFAIFGLFALLAFLPLGPFLAFCPLGPFFFPFWPSCPFLIKRHQDTRENITLRDYSATCKQI